jgi:hypothetical protein
VETPGSDGTKTEPAADRTTDRAAEELATAELSPTEGPAKAADVCAPSPAWDPAREITGELESAWVSEGALSPRRPEAFSSADVQRMVALPPYLAVPTGAVGEPVVTERMSVATPIA